MTPSGQPPSVRAAMMSNGWFAGLPEVVRADIVSRTNVRRVPAGEAIFAAGDHPDGLYVVVEGTVCVSGVSSDGRETVLDFYGPGTWFGEVSLLAGRPRHFGSHASRDSLVAHLPTGDVEHLLASHAAFSRALLRLEADRLQVMLSAIQSYSTLSMDRRLAMRLLMLAEHHGLQAGAGTEIDIDLSHETLARLIGSTRQRVNSILNRWKRAGLVTHHYGRIQLLDRTALERLAAL